MSTDAGTSLERVVVLGFPLMIAPFQLVVVIYLLYGLIGPSMITGIVVVIIALPVNVRIFISLSKVFRNIMGNTDGRLKLVNEMVSGIRIIKSYAWEAPFIANLTEKRNIELKYIRKHAYIFSLGISTVFLQLPLVLQVATFTTYYFLGGVLEPGIVFTALQLFSLLQQVLSQAPSGVNQAVTAYIALRRIQAYLELDELERGQGDVVDLTDENNQDLEELIKVTDASFSWGVMQDPEISETEETQSKRGCCRGSRRNKQITHQTEEKSEELVLEPTIVLENINLSIRRGERIALFGSVGEGKSSLLMAMLGELNKLRGTLQITGSVAYAAQR